MELSVIELIENLGNFGILLVIAGVFLWEHLTSKKKVQETLDQNSDMLAEMKRTNENISKSLDIQKDMLSTIDRKIDCIKTKAGYK